MKRPIEEIEIFKPLPTTLKDDNDWPILPLSNAEITSEGGDLANLLVADENNLMTVIGRVDSLERSQRHHCELVHSAVYQRPANEENSD